MAVRGGPEISSELCETCERESLVQNVCSCLEPLLLRVT